MFEVSGTVVLEGQHFRHVEPALLATFVYPPVLASKAKFIENRMGVAVEQFLRSSAESAARQVQQRK
jgi:hypothetical protein